MKLSVMSYTLARQGWKKNDTFDIKGMAELAQKIGTDGVDMVTTYGLDPKEVRRILDDYGVKTVCHTFPADMNYPTSAERCKGVDQVKAGVEAAVALGTETIMVITPGKPLIPRDVTRRMALEGFVALAPDYLSDLGGTPTDEEAARALFQQLTPPDVNANGIATIAFLKTVPKSTGKVGAIGFCWGGSTVNNLAVASPDLLAAVPYYGGQPKPEDVPKIEARIMAHYGGLDERINAGIPAFEEALKAAGTDHQIFIYEGANHAFNNDTSSARYDKAAADLAWSRTIAFLKETLA